MVQPINYLAQMPQIDIAGRFARGFEIGAGMRQIQEQAQAKQQAEQRLQSFRAEVENAFQQANPDVWLQLKTKYPEYEKVVSPVWEQLDEKQRKAEISQYLPIQAALNAGNKEVAKKYVQRLIDANAAKGRDTKQFQDIADQIDDDINIARDNLVNTTAMVLPLKDFAEAQKKLSETKRAEAMAPAELAAKKRENIPTSIQEAIDYRNLTPEQQQTFQALQVLKKPPAAVTNVNVTNLEKAASGELGKILPDLYEQGNSAASQIKDIKRYRQALEAAFTGPLAGIKFGAARFADAFGFKGDKSIQATRTLIQGFSEMALNARSTMKGTGTITDSEQKLLIKARSGDIDLTVDEMKVIFDVSERVASSQYEKSRKLLKSAAGKSETAAMFLENMSELPMPDQTTPEVVTVGGKTYSRPANFSDSQWKAYKQSVGVR
jgi:hypothetical protein